MHAVLVLHFFEGTRGRAADFAKAGVQAFQFLDPGVGDEVDFLDVAAAEDVADQMALRRITELGTLRQLGRGEAMEVESLGELNRIRGRLKALHHDHALELTAARAAGDLGEQLERTFGGTKVWQLQGKVGVDDADQRHAREVEALGNHLRAEEHIIFTRPKIREDLSEEVLLAHGVRVDTRHAGAREELGDGLLDLLGAVALPADLGRAAARAEHRGALLVVAQVATGGIVGPVQRE